MTKYTNAYYRFFKDLAEVTSGYHDNHIPSGCKPIIRADFGEGEYTVKGFYDPKAGIFHIQEIEKAPSRNQEPSGGKHEKP